MRQIYLLALLIGLLTNVAISQNLTQTVRGTIIDIDSNSPLVGARIFVEGTDPIIGSMSDGSGRFRLNKVPVGRVNIRVTYLGYEDTSVPNLVVNSGKEVVLDLSMQESAVKMDAVVITGNDVKGEALNEMSLISTRSIVAEETERFAGGFSDPSRIVTAFPGVATSNDGDNEIIIRGNSPKYMQWRLEGIEIANPTHFEDQNAAKGGVSLLNNNLLASSDFSTGAFSPEYGDVLSGVYDVKLRVGNNEKFESSIGFGLIGTDLTVEGPFKKGYAGSYLVNYRFSTISLINNLGLVDIDGLLNFQDAAFKIKLPTKKMGVFSLFGLGGMSGFKFEDIKRDIWSTPGDDPSGADIIEDYDKATYLGNVGMNHTLLLNNNSFIKTSFSFTGRGIKDEVFESKTLKVFDSGEEAFRDSILSTHLDFINKLRKSTYRAALTYNNKLDAKNKIQVGVKYAFFDYDYEQSWFDEQEGERFSAIDFRENIQTIRSFVSWKHRVNEDLTIVSGFHNMNVLLNNKHTLEPRLGINWKLNKSNTLSFGYGNHSNMESIHNYFAKVEGEDGSINEPNQDLGLLKAHHLVLGYEKRFTESLRAKLELYYQDLYNLPVENDITSTYATVNEGTDFNYVDLVNEGTGKNYGVEVTLDRFFDNNYYFMLNASLYSSTYKALDGIERNTQYNGSYLANILFGKEFTHLGKKRNKTLALNAKLFLGGGKKQLLLLRDGQGNLAVDPENNRYWDYDNAYKDKLEDIHHLIISASLKFNKPKATHEIFINLDNLTNTKGRLAEYFDADEPDNIGYATQFGFFPNLMYRVYF